MSDSSYGTLYQLKLWRRRRFLYWALSLYCVYRDQLWSNINIPVRHGEQRLWGQHRMGIIIHAVYNVVDARDLNVLTHGNKICKCADDACLITPVMVRWGRRYWDASRRINDDNRSVSNAVVVIDRKEVEPSGCPSGELSGTIRVTSVKIVGFAVTDGLSAADHVRDIITNCAQTVWRVESLACLRHVWLCPSNHLAVSHHYQATVRIQLLSAATRTRPTDTESTDSCAAYRSLHATTVHSTYLHFKRSAWQRTGSSSIKCPPSAVCSSPVNYSCLSKLQSANSTSRQTVTTSGHLMDSSSPVCCIRTPTNLNFN